MEVGAEAEKARAKQSLTGGVGEAPCYIVTLLHCGSGSIKYFVSFYGEDVE